MHFTLWMEERKTIIQFAGFFSDGTVVVYIDGKKYTYITDSFYHSRWKKMARYRPGAALNEIKKLVKAGLAIQEGVLDVIDKSSTWIADVTKAFPQLAREILQAHREPKDVDGGGILNVISKLDKISLDDIREESENIINVKDAGMVIALWQRSKLRQCVELLIRLGEVLHINPIIKSFPIQVVNVWEKFKEVNEAKDLKTKSVAIVALAGAIIAFIHLLTMSAFISGLMAKIALLSGYFGLAGVLGTGCYLAWGLIILLGIVYKKSNSKVLRWVIGIVLSIVSPGRTIN